MKTKEMEELEADVAAKIAVIEANFVNQDTVARLVAMQHARLYEAAAKAGEEAGEVISIFAAESPYTLAEAVKHAVEAEADTAALELADKWGQPAEDLADVESQLDYINFCEQCEAEYAATVLARRRLVRGEGVAI